MLEYYSVINRNEVLIPKKERTTFGMPSSRALPARALGCPEGRRNNQSWRRALPFRGAKVCLELWPCQLPSLVPGTPVSWKKPQWCGADGNREIKGTP